MAIPPADREQYQPGPEYERLESGQMEAEPSGGSDTWLLQLPHYWSMTVASELQLRGGGGGGEKTVTGKCTDDEGTSYAVELDACPAGQPVYAFTSGGGRAQLHACGRRATWIRSEAVLAFHEAANKPKAKRKTPSMPEPAAKQPPMATISVDQTQKVQKVKKHKGPKDKEKKKDKTKGKKKRKAQEQD